MRTPAEDIERLADELHTHVRRLKESEAGAALFTREDVERIVTNRVAREHRLRREAEREVAALERELEELRQTRSEAF